MLTVNRPHRPSKLQKIKKKEGNNKITKEQKMLKKLIKRYGIEHRAVVEFAEVVQQGWSGDFMKELYHEAIEKAENDGLDYVVTVNDGGYIDDYYVKAYNHEEAIAIASMYGETYGVERIRF